MCDPALAHLQSGMCLATHTPQNFPSGFYLIHQLSQTIWEMSVVEVILMPTTLEKHRHSYSLKLLGSMNKAGQEKKPGRKQF